MTEHNRAVTTDFEFFARHEIRRTDDFLFELDEYRRPGDDAQMMIAHMGVFRWAPSVLKQMRHDFALFRAVYRGDIYASPIDDEPKWHKFVKALGYRPLTTVRCLDGLERPMYINRIFDGQQHISDQHQHFKQQHRLINFGP